MTTPSGAAEVAAALPSVLAAGSRDGFERWLAPGVRWGGPDDTEQTCHDREQAGDFYGGLLAAGVRLTVLHASVVDDDKVLARLRVSGPDGVAGTGDQPQVLLTVRDGLVVDILQLDDEPPVVELLYFDGCPNHSALLPHLRRLLSGNGVHSPVQLVEVTDDQEAQRLRFLGSPSLRVNGRDVEPGADHQVGYGLQCRIYSTPDGPSGTPADAWILDALAPVAGEGR